MTVATLTARYQDEFPSWADITVEFPNDRPAAEELVAKLPKSYRPRITQLFVEGGSIFQVVIGANLLPTAGNLVNETGIKRVRAAEKKLTALGYTVEFAPIPHISNSYQTRFDFEVDITGGNR
jgi:hypothetical protein